MKIPWGSFDWTIEPCYVIPSYPDPSAVRWCSKANSWRVVVESAISSDCHPISCKNEVETGLVRID
jgi:hypothetical protein